MTLKTRSETPAAWVSEEAAPERREFFFLGGKKNWCDERFFLFLFLFLFSRAKSSAADAREESSSSKKKKKKSELVFDKKSKVQGGAFWRWRRSSFFFPLSLSRLWQRPSPPPPLPPRYTGLAALDPSFHHAHSVDFDSTRSMGWSATARAGLFWYFFGRENRERMSANSNGLRPRPSKEKTAKKKTLGFRLFAPVSRDGEASRGQFGPDLCSTKTFSSRACGMRRHWGSRGVGGGGAKGKAGEALFLFFPADCFCLAKQHPLFLVSHRHPLPPPQQFALLLHSQSGLRVGSKHPNCASRALLESARVCRENEMENRRVKSKRVKKAKQLLAEKAPESASFLFHFSTFFLSLSLFLFSFSRRKRRGRA